MKNLILVIDDDQDLLDMMLLILKSDGYKVLTAINGKQGIDMARAYTPDLIILDIMMPGMNGYDVCRALQEDPQTAEINIIFLSAKGNFMGEDEREVSAAIEEQLEGFDSGAMEFLTKPVSKQILLKKIEFMLWLNNKLGEPEKSAAGANGQSRQTPHGGYQNHRSSLRRLHHAADQNRAMRVLVIDDDATLLRIVQVALQSHGYEVFTTGNGFSGLEQAKKLTPDLIILDINMPYMNGHEVCRRLRSDPTTADIYILMLTAVVDSEEEDAPLDREIALKERVRGIKSGADDFLIKPIVVKDLLTVVDHLTNAAV